MTSTRRTKTKKKKSSQCLNVFVRLRQVLDVCPLPGMVLSPREGVVPGRGQAVIEIHFNPDCVMRFDVRVEVRRRERERAVSLFSCCTCVEERPKTLRACALQIALRNTRATIKLRVDGSVAIPKVDMDVVSVVLLVNYKPKGGKKNTREKFLQKFGRISSVKVWILV